MDDREQLLAEREELIRDLEAYQAREQRQKEELHKLRRALENALDAIQALARDELK